ncbi:hypothetical protein Acr_00g0042670 [Actinidia rufa]|uniref:Uncharacterized protein n=1 Tax=Actinidia rufa TaxID=165716 RepID=A0A7J0DIL1_9ERIC|nr:hypothetical protein Acr_00g0042670 [Actinidia rufa]
MVPFTEFLTELFKRHDVHIPIDLTRIETEKPIDKYSLIHSEGQRNKRKLEEGASEQPSIGILALQKAIANLRLDFDTRMTLCEEQFGHLEEQSGRHTTLFQGIKGMLISMQAKEDDEEEEDD